MSICLTALLIGCGTVKTKYVYQCNIPASLTQPNNEPHIDKRITWGQCPVLYTELLNELRQCNADKKAIMEVSNKKYKPLNFLWK
ncbi:Rz1-like lysis system protein LysC [Gilliamella sp. Bim1-2]